MSSLPPTAPREFHVSRQARDRYGFDQMLFSLQGEVLFANFSGARKFAQQINAKRDLIRHPEKMVRAGQLNAMGLIDEIMHYVVGDYARQVNPHILSAALAGLERTLGVQAVHGALRLFCDEFPPIAVYRHDVDVDAYLAGETAGVPNRVLALEEMLLLWLANMDPAYNPYGELFDDSHLVEHTVYRKMMEGLQGFFTTQPAFGPDVQPLIDMLRTPALLVPDSLTGQLEYILAHWGVLLGGRFLYRLLSSLDLIKEEEKAIFLGPGPSHVYDFTGMGDEPERFSPDKDWMPQTVILAKNVYVWLDQLSKTYGRHIYRLDQIPDEELDTLARRGFNCLWLIGLWERSVASQRIKQMCGNPDAVASAYSLMDYAPAHELGGDEAVHDLRERAGARGIRLASDMVPNHVGIDSRWVIEHPDWFIYNDYSPFPSYTFNGPNLSWDSRVGLFLEDHYYARSDAAVVFKRVDFHTGREQYIYHGNDGTSMPWNDTAQLNYLLAEVREAVIQTILHVARNFPVIRFDAAMTLAKKHYQRLWFPEPGHGGDIPSRADHAMTRPQFHEAFPVEFWREVVDRVAAEAPDTLLLAEAFWLMEGYFVRTLGMHRVYNSAFMNMLRDEDNAKYRSVIKNTLEFDPEILKRYVNFMNNPDERTAIDQFGTGDKYFGICTVLCTLPGLPMFGHGQVEGFSEKYGMEFRRAYWDEWPKEELVRRHEREIFPLLHRRHVFAEATHFLLYDFFSAEGGVNEDVFAYSNRAGDERGLVLYHNKWAEARGWIRTSAAYAVKGAEGKTLAQHSLGEGLGLHDDGEYFTIFRDMTSGLEYLRNSRELCERGLYVELGAYRFHVFMDFREVVDNAWHHYAHLAGYLNGRGVPSIDEALREIFLQPVHGPYKSLVNGDLFTRLFAARGATPDPALLDDVTARAATLLRAVASFTGVDAPPETLAGEVRAVLTATLALTDDPDDPVARLGDDREAWGTLLGWVCTHALGKVVTTDYPAQSRAWIDEWLLGRILAGALEEFGLAEDAAWRGVAAVKLLTEHQRWFTPEITAAEVVEALFSDPELQRLLGVNRYQQVLWFNQQAFEHALGWLECIAALTLRVEGDAAALPRLRTLVATLQQAAVDAEYQVETLRVLARHTLAGATA